MKTLNEKIVEEAKRWLGVPYQNRSSSKYGCDCTGLLLGIMQVLGYVNNYKLRLYPKDWNLHGMADNHIEYEISKVADLVIGPAIPGDIVLFKFKAQKFIAHIGIIIEQEHFIHCWERSRCVQISALKQWTRRIAAIYRFNMAKLESYN